MALVTNAHASPPLSQKILYESLKKHSSKRSTKIRDLLDNTPLLNSLTKGC